MKNLRMIVSDFNDKIELMRIEVIKGYLNRQVGIILSESLR
jgi:hypothetical protein